MIHPATMALAALLLAGPAGAAEDVVSALPLKTFKGVTAGQKVDGLIWRGGLVLDGQTDLFGGLSGIAFVSPQNHLVMVSDHGNFVSGQLLYDEAGAPLSFIGVTIDPITNSRGNDLPRAFAQDSEGIDAIMREGVAAAVRVSFENLTRVADFDLMDGKPVPPAREVPIPAWVSAVRTNESLESVCIAPPASPVAGSSVLLLENSPDADGNQRGTMLGHNDKGPLALAPIPGVHPSDCAFLPNGDLLVLERGIALLSFEMVLLRIRADQVRPNTVMAGRPILTAMGGDIDNMEGMAVHPGPGGHTRITLISDNNFNDWERTLLLEFTLPEGDPASFPSPATPPPATPAAASPGAPAIPSAPDTAPAAPLPPGISR